MKAIYLRLIILDWESDLDMWLLDVDGVGLIMDGEMECWVRFLIEINDYYLCWGVEYRSITKLYKVSIFVMEN